MAEGPTVPEVSKLSLVPLIAVALLGLVLGGGFLYLRQRQKKANPAKAGEVKGS